MKINKHLYLPLTILACFMWSTAFAGVKIGFKYMPAPFHFAGIRFFLAGLILVPFSWKKDFYKQIKKNFRLIAYITISRTFIGYALYYTAMAFVKGSIASIVIGSSPLISAIVSHFMMDNDKFTKKKLLSLSLGILGISVIMLNTKPMTKVGLMELIGILLLLLNSITGALVNVKIAQAKKNIDPVFLSSNQMIFGGLMLLILGLFTEGRQNLNLPIEFYASLIWLAIVSAVAFSIWFILLQQPGIKVSELNMWKFIIPLSGAILSWILLPDESPDAVSLIGMGFILISLILYFRPAKKVLLENNNYNN